MPPIRSMARSRCQPGRAARGGAGGRGRRVRRGGGGGGRASGSASRSATSSASARRCCGCARLIERQPDAAFGGIAFGPRVIVSQAALGADRADPARRAGQLRVPAAAAGRQRSRRLGSARRAPPFPKPAGNCAAAPTRRPSLQRLYRAGRVFPEPGRHHRAAGRRGRHRQRGRRLCREQDRGDRDLEMPRRLDPAGLRRLSDPDPGAGARRDRRRHCCSAALAPVAGRAAAARAVAGRVAARRLSGAAGPRGAVRLAGDLAFALWPLAAIGRVPPGALLRDTVAPAPPPACRCAAIAATAAAALGLAALIVADRARPPRRAVVSRRRDRRLRAVPRSPAGLIVAAARRLPRRPRRPAVRLALANLHRPGAPTRAGRAVARARPQRDGRGRAGQGNLAVEIETRLAERAPADFFIDIQPDQLAGFARDRARRCRARSFEQVPMLRGRITRLNGVPVEAGARWRPMRNGRCATTAA